MAGYHVKFVNGKKGGVICYVSGKVSFPVRGWTPSVGEEWLVEVIKSKERFNIVKPIRPWKGKLKIIWTAGITNRR